ncbi:unnamed protein product, partial [Iphiclides podalirius]
MLEDTNGIIKAEEKSKPKSETKLSPASHTSAMMRDNVEIEAELDNGNSDSQDLTDDFEGYVRRMDLDYISRQWNNYVQVFCTASDSRNIACRRKWKSRLFKGTCGSGDVHLNVNGKKIYDEQGCVSYGTNDARDEHILEGDNVTITGAQGALDGSSVEELEEEGTGRRKWKVKK